MEDENKNELEEKNRRPPLSDIAATGALWIWGALLVYTPTYLGLDGWWQYLFYALGFIGLTISFAVTLISLGSAIHSKGLSHWGLSSAFLVPALALFLLIEYQHITGTLLMVAKVAVLLLTALGVPFLFIGASYLFWKEGNSENPENSSVTTINKEKKEKSTLEIVANIIIAMLALATAVITLTEKILP